MEQSNDFLKLKEMENSIVSIENFVKEEISKLQKQGAVVGISGGIDSAITATICAKSLESKNVFRVNYARKRIRSYK